MDCARAAKSINNVVLSHDSRADTSHISHMSSLALLYLLRYMGLIFVLQSSRPLYPSTDVEAARGRHCAVTYK